MSESKLKWYVKFDSNGMKVEGFPWSVWKGGFRDSTHECKYFAEQRRAYLNKLEEGENE